jgi:hypothetical protein
MRIWSWSIAVGVWSVVCAPFVEAGEQPAIRQLGLCYTGFGVPGSGRPYIFAGQALVNAGEGYPTLCDISDAQNPRIMRFLPSWFFTTFLYPLPARDLVYLSSSRGPLLVIEGVRIGSVGGYRCLISVIQVGPRGPPTSSWTRRTHTSAT